MLADKFGTTSNVKSPVNCLSVLRAITSIKQRLKLYNKVPPNGLVVYCGTIVTEEGKEKKVNIDFEPFKPINTSLYLCDNKSHTEALTALLLGDSKFDFIVIDGSGALWGTLQGNTREVLHKFTVDLPQKHGRGGQSALCFARLGVEKQNNHVQKAAEIAVQSFNSEDKVNVAGLVLARSADFKSELSQYDMFDKRLQSKKLEAVEILIVYENLDLMRYILHYQETGQEHELIENMSLLKCFANNYKKKKTEARLEIVIDKSQEESQFLKGFVDIQGMEYHGGDDEFFYLDDY
ncbi:unnamed protein product [Nyctereutes procyonoides]|uniref:Eukaryotic peptide chain release factor subunit 1 n=1 Tax=Nyctereutes procyonoides TaxID=34880 RepID=A0A811Z0Y8_NYCPR|nr:unnamed protein product [Nyctereutes procyonoides]